MKRKPITQRLCVFLTALVLYSACSPSIEDIIEQLGHGGKAGARAKRELLLAKDRSVDPLLKALEEPRFAVARPEIVDVLVSLLMRVEDPRILPTLKHHLRSDPNATVRARIIQKLSLHKHLQAVGAFFAALSDGDGEVRFQALSALGLLTKDLDAVQRHTLRSAARRLLKDEHSQVQLEARALVGVYVKQWVDEARQQTLKGDVALAESLLQQALAYSPNSKLANYRLGRLYFDNGQREQGLEQLKKHNMLVEISPLATMPKIDGRIDDRAWEEATA